MKKWGQVAMLLIGVIVALWVAVNSVLVSESQTARDEAEKALRAKLDPLAAREAESTPAPPPPDARNHTRDDEPQPPPDHEERWRRVFERVDGLFDHENQTEAYRAWADLRSNYREPISWTDSRVAVLEHLLAEYDDAIQGLLALTELGIPPPRTLCHGDDAPFTGHIQFDCIQLLLVASAVEAHTADFTVAHDHLVAAMTLFSWTFSRGTGAFYPEIDVPAERVLRSGVLSASDLADLKAHWTRIMDRNALIVSTTGQGERVIARFQRPAWKHFSSFEGKISAFAQETFLRPWYDDAQRQAFEHAGRLAELARLPYYQIRDELATIDQEAETEWYNTTVYNPARWDTQCHFVYQARWEARRDMVRMAITLEEHFAEHDAYPDSLEGVAPAFDGGLPIDVFTGDPYHYRRTDDGFVLHSSGKNGIDDGGNGDDVVLRMRLDRDRD